MTISFDRSGFDRRDNDSWPFRLRVVCCLWFGRVFVALQSPFSRVVTVFPILAEVRGSSQDDY